MTKEHTTDLAARIEQLEAALARQAQEHTQQLNRQAIVNAGYRLGVVDPGTLAELADAASMRLDASGALQNADEVAEATAKARLWLLPPPPAPQPTPAPEQRPAQHHSRSNYVKLCDELASQPFDYSVYLARKDEIEAAEAELRLSTFALPKPSRAPAQNTPTIRLSQLSDINFVRQSADLIEDASRAGTLIDDTGAGATV